MKKFCLILFFAIIINNLLCTNINSFEIFKRNFRSSFAFSHVLKKHGHIHINRAEANMMRGGKHMNIAGRDVIYNDKIFDNNTKDIYGSNNCLRMSKCFSPIGNDGIEINLHHLHQKDDSVIVETLSDYHRKYSSELHSYKNKSEIDRNRFSDTPC